MPYVSHLTHHEYPMQCQLSQEALSHSKKKKLNNNNNKKVKKKKKTHKKHLIYT